MQRQVWKRLDQVGVLLSQRITQNVIVIQDMGETGIEIEDKINRWKVGEVVDGIRDVYDGRNVNSSCVTPRILNMSSSASSAILATDCRDA
ncbi:MAG: hypothetical protein IH951_13800 [Bacteroidetes bacterium]|nr:hypothetical protein [Bacteroidota bacterium]